MMAARWIDALYEGIIFAILVFGLWLIRDIASTAREILDRTTVDRAAINRAADSLKAIEDRVGRY